MSFVVSSRAKLAALVLVVLSFSVDGFAQRVLLVSDDNFEVAPARDDSLVELLEGAGYEVDISGMGQNFNANNSPFAPGNEDKLDALLEADLVVVSRRTNSGGYGADAANWNALEVPILLMSGYLTRTSRWGWHPDESGDANTALDSIDIEPDSEDHPFVAKFESPLAIADYAESGGVVPKGYFLPNADPVEGEVIARLDGKPFLMEIEEGALAADGFTEMGARRVFLAQWGYDLDAYVFTDVSTPNYFCLVLNVVSQMILGEDDPCDPDPCPPPASALRDLTPQRGPPESNGDFEAGDRVPATITLQDIRVADEKCTVPGDVTLVETLPTGWIAEDVTADGVYDDVANTVTWVIPAAEVTEGRAVSYTAVAPDTLDTAVFRGALTEGDELPYGVGGDLTLTAASDFDSCGGIRAWNILGAFLQSGGANPPEADMELDYLTDGDVTELDFEFLPGATIETDFFGAAASTGLFLDANDRNPDGVPTVVSFVGETGLINLNDDVYGGGPDQVMAYVQTYVFNDTGSELEVNLGVSSDDSVQVILNGETVWLYSVARGGSSACTPQDSVPDGLGLFEPPLLLEGENSLILKIFEGGGGWQTSLVIRDMLTLEPITEGLTICLDPTLERCGGGPPPGVQFRRGDVDNSGGGNITDAIAVLNHLFAGTPRPGCWAAGDANGDGSINVADPVFHLNFLFGGGSEPAAPGPDDCGSFQNAADEALGCEEYTSC